MSFPTLLFQPDIKLSSCRKKRGTASAVLLLLPLCLSLSVFQALTWGCQCTTLEDTYYSRRGARSPPMDNLQAGKRQDTRLGERASGFPVGGEITPLFSCCFCSSSVLPFDFVPRQCRLFPTSLLPSLQLLTSLLPPLQTPTSPPIPSRKITVDWFWFWIQGKNAAERLHCKSTRPHRKTTAIAS